MERSDLLDKAISEGPRSRRAILRRPEEPAPRTHRRAVVGLFTVSGVCVVEVEIDEIHGGSKTRLA